MGGVGERKYTKRFGFGKFVAHLVVMLLLFLFFIFFGKQLFCSCIFNIFSNSVSLTCTRVSYQI